MYEIRVNNPGSITNEKQKRITYIDLNSLIISAEFSLLMIKDLGKTLLNLIGHQANIDKIYLIPQDP